MDIQALLKDSSDIINTVKFDHCSNEKLLDDDITVVYNDYNFLSVAFNDKQYMNEVKKRLTNVKRV
jgi:hypothetical protein